MEKEEQEQKNQPSRRLLGKIFALTFLSLLIAGAIWGNGPGIRLALTRVLAGELEKQGLTGDFEIKGTALSGLAIHQLSATGPLRIQAIESDLISLTWSLSSLKNRALDSLSLEKLHLTIDPKAPTPPRAPQEDREKKPLADTLETIRQALQPADISLSDLQVTIVDESRFSLDSFTHRAGTTTYQVAGLTSRDPSGRQVSNAETKVTWTAEQITLDRFELYPELALRDLTFKPDDSLDLRLFAVGSELIIASDLARRHLVRLSSQSLSLEKLAKLIDPKLPLAGTVTSLDFDTSKRTLSLKGENLRWQNTTVSELSIIAKSDSFEKPYEEPIEILLNLGPRLSAAGMITLEKKIIDSQAQLSLTSQEKGLPTIIATLDYANREAHLEAETLDEVFLSASYFVDSSSYEAEGISKLIDASRLTEGLKGPLIFNLQATGNIEENTHRGTLNLEELQLNQAGLPSGTSSAEFTYDWPQEIKVSNLSMRSKEGQLNANLEWKDDLLRISNIDLVDGTRPMLSAQGTLPLPAKTRSLLDLLSLSTPIELDLRSEPLSFSKLSEFVPLPPKFSGIFEADLKLVGTYREPILNGTASLEKFATSKQEQIPPLNLDLNFETIDQRLILKAKASEASGPLLDLNGKIPFLPYSWMKRSETVSRLPLEIKASSTNLDLKRLQALIPAIQSVDGQLNLEVNIGGTLSEPQYSGEARATIESMRIPKSPISDIRDAVLDLSFSDSQVTFETSDIQASGGNAKITGTVNLASPEPELDLNFTGRYFPLYRTPDFTFRCHPNLRLQGPFSTATISGKIELVESLFYKDIEILPFGNPITTDIPEPKLPSFKPPAPAATNTSGSSGGVEDWKLNIAVTTLDPILVRGNLAKGKIVGDVQLSGTIGNPQATGKITATELEADLPFSNLLVRTGEVTLQEDDLTNPIINLRGSSKVGQYLVQVYLTGPIKNPDFILSSDPPLPENEIMLLLATGSASAGLEDRQIASQKALQYLFEGIRRRNRDKDKSVLQRLIKNSDQLELSLGDTNQFSGRQFSSASLELGDNWNFTTQIDAEGQTRALVVFSIRLR